MALKLRLDNAVRAAADTAAQDRGSDGTLLPGEQVMLSSLADPGTSALTLRGFGAFESDGVWTVGAAAQVEVRLRGVALGARHRLILNVLPFEAEGHRALIGMSINGGPSHHILRQGQGWQRLKADCPIKAKGAKGSLLIEFQIANPMSPSALSIGNDDRALGLKLGMLRIEEVDGATEAVEEVVAVPIDSDANVPAASSGLDTLPKPYQLIHQLVNRGPLLRKLLLDKNPLVRVVRWMRRVSRGMVSMQEQLDLIRLDSARQAYELSRLIDQSETEFHAVDSQRSRASETGLGAAEHELLRADTRPPLDEVEVAVRRMQRELQSEMRNAFETIRSTQEEIYAALRDSARDVIQLRGESAAMLDVIRSSAGGEQEVARFQHLEDLITSAHGKLDQVGLAIAAQARRDSVTHPELLAHLQAVLGDVQALMQGASRRVLRTSSGWIINTGFGHFSCDERDDLLAVCLAEYGDVERGLRLFLERVLQPGDVFVDAGANIGLHTVVGARAVGPEGRVFAIEAMPRTLEHLRASVRLSMVEESVTIFPVAAGAQVEDGRVFHIGVVSGHSSLYALPEEVASVPVDIRPLDALIDVERVALVKIDVEGAELEVIAGMKQLIARNPGIAIVAEYAASHLQRVGTDRAQWERMCQDNAFVLHVVDDLTGQCNPIEGLAAIEARPSSNILMCRADSPVLAALHREVLA
ncbi:FkbM family methyltransferase [Xanthomonas codiaei]|nr:FkbM family methyltransferase [Xanthomonas codiaei]